MADLNADVQSYYPSMTELLSLPIFRGGRLLAGHAGLEKQVTGVNLSDTPEYYNWLSPGELMVTTCYAIRNDPAAQAAFVSTLAEKGMSGLCIKPGQYLGDIPEVMIAQAEELGLPLVRLPEGVRFSAITKAVADELLCRQTALLRSILTINEMLTRTIVEGADLEEIASMVSDMTRSTVLILDCINDRRALHLSETDAARFRGLRQDQVCAAVVAGGQMYALEVGGHSFGFLYVYDLERPLTPQDERILAQVFQAIPLEISRERTVRESSDRLQEDFILHLLSDKIADEEEEYARAASLGIDLRENHLIARARILDRPDGGNKYAGVFQRTLLANEVRSTLGNLGVTQWKIHTGGEYLIILSSPLDHRGFTALCEQFPTIVARFDRDYPALRISAGCGRVHGGIAGLRQSDYEARVAFKAAAGGEGLLLFSRLGLLRLIYAADAEEEINSFVQETLGKLLEREPIKRLELINTLDSYLRNFGNLKRVSEELFTHYNTVSYRMKTIRELTGLDPRNAEERVLLEAALYLYHYKRRGK